MPDPDLHMLMQKVIEFRDKRDWAQFHNPKDLAISLSLEASELLELFQWKNPQQVEAAKSEPQSRSRVAEELADVLIYALTLAHEFGMDPARIVMDKMRINEEKYPAELVKGKAEKQDMDRKGQRS